LEQLLDDMGFIQNLNINEENLPCIVPGIRYVCIRSGLREQVDSCMRIARVSLALFFQK